MEVGFETIGNATIICHDRRPILATDPWVIGDAYFGSWTFSHEIPEEQLEHVGRCEYAWLSHGHPDHLNGDSLRILQAKQILLPDHRGGRIHNDLKSMGFNVRVLKDRTWHQLSDRIRVLCIADYNQDGILLIDINGRLILNLNDAADRGWGRAVRNIAKDYKLVFLLKLAGFGDADMMNFFDESGQRIPPPAARRDPVGEAVAIQNHFYGARYFIPFSSMHKYQRADSIWVSRYTTDLTDYAVGFQSRTSEILPAFIKYDCKHDTLEEINPAEKVACVHSPEDFGDNWTDPLCAEEFARLKSYFQSIEHLHEQFDYLNFRVGGKDNLIDLGRNHTGRAITFEVPRNSLMTAIEYHVFDDLLIGNFMKTTLHGDFGEGKLYPDFTPYVAKYADNGKARTRDELRAYFHDYRNRDCFDYFRHQIEKQSRRMILSLVDSESKTYRLSASVYHFLTSS